jgi:adenylyltransferase/sulfurtransferase
VLPTIGPPPHSSPKPTSSHGSRHHPQTDNIMAIIDSLRQQIASCEATLHDLRQQLVEAEHNHRQQEKVLRQKKPLALSATDPLDHDMNFGIPDDFRTEVFAVLDHEAHSYEHVGQDEPSRWPLEASEYKRYGRQLIMPEIGLQGAFPAY